MKYYFLALGTLVVVCVGCSVDGQQLIDKGEYHAPPASMMSRPGPMVDGPGPGVMPMMGPPPARAFSTQTTQVRFVGPAGMSIGWQIGDTYAMNQLTTPGTYDFHQGATYRLKLTDIPGRQPGLKLYPTLQIYPAHPTTDAYLAHNSVPLELSDEDLDQVDTNNFVTKVIYLPDPKFQDLAIAGVETLVSTRLDPGVDPVHEADQRGTIMAVLRIGNMVLERVGQPGGDVNAAIGPNGQVQQVAYRKVDGDEGQHMHPVPIAYNNQGPNGVPGPMMMGAPAGPGQPPYNPISGQGGTPIWGTPITGTPIGLPGPPHLPYGGPAGLRSHTVRNLTDQELPEPVDHYLMDVKHKPGLRLPKPVKHVEYTEQHPVYKPGQVSYPRGY